MNDRYLSLWALALPTFLAAVLFSGLLVASWQEKELSFKFGVRALLGFTALIAAVLWVIMAVVKFVW